MASVPADVAAEAERVRSAAAAVVPAKADGNLLIGTWNIRAFGGLTRKWTAGERDTPKRDWRAVALIAAVVSRFDVAAIQEVRRDTTALHFLLELLGPRWAFITSDVTEGDKGNDERLTFVFDTDRVEPSGLVGEVVLPAVVNHPAQQFARTPYAASFVRAGVEFILTTVHVLWGDRASDRLAELAAFADWMRGWANRVDDWNGNLLALGDFNIDRLDDPLFAAFVSTGLWPPAELNAVPRTVFDDDREHHFYDQIAWFTDVERAPARDLLHGLGYHGHAGGFDFAPHVYPELDVTAKSWRISDHYPLWVEFDLDRPSPLGTAAPAG
ncbi:endonuclease/exonuclease/phosphatase family protein [Naasia sp. SYSU D00057]|uniref:endonuclease/exonuclease/phosphatase family protein n=1 Tax=Naasia sp. SYSU D00057 TaxID=2817380 RepID=UPI001B314110|nr:endonuclease/exonuclease/phosphatase family protein [Naasia sp. SYSU D00057]